MCDIPYKYIIKLETFAEDYQFLMRKFGFWEKFNAKHKLIGIVKGIFDQATLSLRLLTHVYFRKCE